MLETPADFKEQMVEARRMQILMGAAQVFAKKGFHKATTREIAKAASVSEGTIYNYFENKRDLLVAMIDAIGVQSVRNIVIDHPPEDPGDYLRAVLKDRYQFAKNFGNRLMPIIAEMLTDEEMRETVYSQVARPLASYIENFVQTNIDSGRFRPVDTMVVTRSFVGMLFINFALKLSGLEERYNNLSEDELIEQVISIFLDGLLIDDDNEE